ncbi:soluble lytic murein transglycosylase [Caloramator fervidus]|uniref:Soluble lytic murein transglycosylase n=1 Tax=Caloramator fervidus TaxID=29344 RepID=A0A1H5VU69_9CLOT|nr:lytic transglycosylase domain-containing protein [Caloramator fervidus]SEF90107.1 soluble lytic murein transglycosylase [Caloramator fervidus]
MYKKNLLILLVVLFFIFNFKNIMKLFYPIKYKEYVFKYSKEYNIDPYLVFALIKAESNFDECAQSRKGAIGLMQITPKTGEYIAKLLNERYFSREFLYDPEINIKFGVFYLSKLYRDFNYDIDFSLAAYNAGEGNVRRWIKNNVSPNELPYKETKLYIKKVKCYYYKYKWLYEKKFI